MPIWVALSLSSFVDQRDDRRHRQDGEPQADAANHSSISVVKKRDCDRGSPLFCIMETALPGTCYIKAAKCRLFSHKISVPWRRGIC